MAKVRYCLDELLYALAPTVKELGSSRISVSMLHHGLFAFPVIELELQL